MYRHGIVPERAIGILIGIIASCVAAGCGADEQGTSTRTNEGGRSASGISVEYFEMGVPPSIATTSAAVMAMSRGASGSLVDAVRMVIKTAVVECEVSNCDSTAAEIEGLVVRETGYIVSSTLTSRDDRRTGVVVLRVPVQGFETTLAEVKTLARVVERVDVRGDDVTEEFVDLTARLENKRKAEQRFLDILKSADDAPEILEIETALMGLREDIERLEGRKRYMENQSALGTINFIMHEPVPVVVARTEGFWNKLGSGVGSGAERGLNGIVHTASATVAFLTAGIPLVLGVVLIGWGAVRMYRRFKPRRIADDTTGV